MSCLFWGIFVFYRACFVVLLFSNKNLQKSCLNVTSHNETIHENLQHGSCVAPFSGKTARLPKTHVCNCCLSVGWKFHFKLSKKTKPWSLHSGQFWETPHPEHQKFRIDSRCCKKTHQKKIVIGNFKAEVAYLETIRNNSKSFFGGKNETYLDLPKGCLMDNKRLPIHHLLGFEEHPFKFFKDPGMLICLYWALVHRRYLMKVWLRSCH